MKPLAKTLFLIPAAISLTGRMERYIMTFNRRTVGNEQ
jgi:hypothetical protein